MTKWMKIVSAGSMMFAWFSRASADGKITSDEVLELLSHVLEIFELDIALPKELFKQ